MILAQIASSVPVNLPDVPDWVHTLPVINATLNGLTTLVLLAGFIAIKLKHRAGHAACMITALVLSAAFLSCYLTYHFYGSITYFTTPGWPKALYYVILIPHVILAVAILPFIGMAVYYASQQNFVAHSRITRWLWPTWMYVSVTGVLVYLMLYVWFPGQPHLPGL